MKMKPARTGIDFKIDSESLCPITLDWEPCAVAMRRGRFITEPWASADGRRDEGIIGYFLNKSTAVLMKLDKDAQMTVELHGELKSRGIKTIELEHLSATELDQSGKFMKDICLWLVAPEVFVHPEYWKPSEEVQAAVKAADSPMKEHLQTLISNLQAVSSGIKNAENLFPYKPSLKASSAPSIQ